MPSSAPTRSEAAPAATLVRTRLAEFLDGLGLAHARRVPLDALIDRTFARPPDDAVFLSNWLIPGALPLEWSFSEDEPGALRFEIQPFEPELSGNERLEAAIAMLSLLNEGPMPDDVPTGFANAFGAFMGFVLRRDGGPTVKLYCEMTGSPVSPGNDEVAQLPGARPLLRSFAFRGQAVATRDYFRLDQGLDLFALEAVCAALGIAHRFPSLLMVLMTLTGGASLLPPGSVALGLRREDELVELKVEVLGVPLTLGSDLHGQIGSLLQPPVRAPFETWSRLALIRPTHGVISAKVATDRAACLTIYAGEPSGAW